MADDKLNKWDQFYAQARAQGYSRDEVSGFIGVRLNNFRTQAKAKGYSDTEVDSYLGYKDPAPAEQSLAANAQQNLQARGGVSPQVVATNPFDAFKAGVEASSGGLMARGKLPDTIIPQHAGMAMRLAQQGGELVGDAPAMVAGAVAGAGLGGAGGAGAGAAVPVAGETGSSEAVGGLGGAAVGGYAGASALPEFIKQEYVDGLTKGYWKSPQDFAARTGHILWETTKQGMVGAATAAVGGKTGLALAKAGTAINPFGKLAIRTTAELAAMTTTSSVLNARLPTKEDVLDGAVFLAALHVAGGAAERIIPNKRVVVNAKENLAQNWADTEEPPVAAARRAASDPAFRTKMQAPPIARPVPASAKAPTATYGDFVLDRAPGAFDDAVKFMMTTQEGGGHLVVDTGGATKWGISKKANPDIDIEHLTPQQAMEVYHDRYWKPINADAIADPKLRLAAFDAAVNQGVGNAKEWLRESGGDLGKFMKLRAEQYAGLLKRDPDKYGQYEHSWNQRMDNLGAPGTIRQMRPDVFDEGFKEPSEEPPAEPPPPDYEGDPWGAVRSSMAEFNGAVKETSLASKLGDWGLSAYREFFNPQHPINLLVDKIESGGSLEDLENPKFLYRLAELSGDQTKYVIERDMTDIDGNVVGPGLKKIIGDLKGSDWRDFLTYAKAKWAVEIAGQAKESGVEVEAARKVSEAGAARFENRFNQLVEFRNSTLAWMRDSGFVDQTGYEKMVAEHKASIPGYRALEGEKPLSSGGGNVAMGNPVKRLFGSKAQTRPILESLLRETFLRRQMASWNRANAELAIKAQEMNLAGKVTAPPMRFELTPEEMEKFGMEEDADGMPAIFRRLSQGLGKDDVPIFMEGKRQAWKFADPEIARFLRGYDRVSLNTLARFASKITNVTRNLIVLNPLFPVHLMQYDVPWQFMVKPGFRNTLGNAISGIGEIVGNGKAYDAWLHSGGAERVFGGLSKDSYIKEVLKGKEDPSFGQGAWNAISSPYHAVRAWSQMLTSAQRVGRFKEGLAQGETPVRAGVASSEAAFHRAGFGGPWAKMQNAVTPFFNAYLNSLEQTVRAQFGIGKTITGEKFNPAEFTVKAAAIITLPVLANWWLNKDKEWYKSAPDWQKDNGLLFHVGDDWVRGKGNTLTPQGHTFFWKNPPLVSLLYGGIPRRLAEAFLEDNPHAFDGMTKNLGESLLPGGGIMTYNVFLPMIEHVANHSFFRDQPLVDDDLKRAVMGPEQFNQYSTQTAIQLSRFVNDLPLLKGLGLSPPVIDNYIQGWSGTLGAGAVKAAEMALGLKHGAPSPHLEDWPLLSSFMARYPGSGSAPIQEFENHLDQFNQVHGSLVKAIEMGDLPRFQEIASKNPTASAAHAFNLKGKPVPGNHGDYMRMLHGYTAGADLQSAQTILRVDKALKQERQYIALVYANEHMSPNDKRQIIDQAYAQMQVIAERGNDALKKAGY